MIEESLRNRTYVNDLQAQLLDRLLDAVLPDNRFYAEKFRQAGLSRQDVRTPGDLSRLPFTTKAELLADQERHPPYGSALTYPLGEYTRLHQTSGTKGQPLRWLDTSKSWQWMLSCWTKMFRIAGITKADRLFFPFSFGPFLGFWTAFEAGTGLGAMCLAAGGMSSTARLRMLLDNRATVVFCTPTYALHLAQAAKEQGIALDDENPDYKVRRLVVAGEPGGSISATRARLEELWHARVFDHSGMTEVGPMTIECSKVRGGLHVLEGDYCFEVIDPVTEAVLEPGKTGELVVTNLDRVGSPVLRYRTGDLVQMSPTPCPCGLPFVRLDGGILGRTDDMISIRGNNFFPSALENVLRRFSEILEYRVTVDCASPLAQLEVEIEAPGVVGEGFASSVAQAIHDQLWFRADVTLVAPGTLPRFEMKAQRVRKK